MLARENLKLNGENEHHHLKHLKYIDARGILHLLVTHASDLVRTKVVSRRIGEGPWIANPNVDLNIRPVVDHKAALREDLPEFYLHAVTSH
jgi:hypothetical protein